MKKQATYIVPSVIESIMTGVQLAQITPAEIKLRYVDGSEETRVNDGKQRDKYFFNLVSYVQAGRAK